MQDNTQYTRCPECKTAFKVTDKLLSMAKGKVRCGACLVVFQATDYILKPKNKTPQTAPLNQSQPATVQTQASAIQTQAPLDFNPSDSVEIISVEQTTSTSEAKPEESEISETSEIPVESLEITSSNLDVEDEFTTELTDEALFDNSDNITIDDDFELAEESDFNLSTAITEDSLPIIDDDGKVIDEYNDVEDNDVKDNDSYVNTDDDPEISFAENEDDVIDFNIDSDLKTDPDFKTDLDLKLETNFEMASDNFEPEEADINQKQTIKVESIALDDFLSDSVEINEVVDKTEDFFNESEFVDENQAIESEENFVESDGTDSILDIDTIDEQLENDILTSEVSAETISEDFIDINDDDDFDKMALDLTDQINNTDTDPDPLDEFEERVEKKKTSLRTAIIYAVTFILLVISSLQFWNNRQTLAWDSTWGSLTKGICSVLPCDLKPHRDISKIRLSQKHVLPMEGDENKLNIKLLLINEATFDQPYPTITVKFSNTQGETVEIKRFEVKDYFPEKQDEQMPTNTEVHISFKTEIPHPNALGIEFDFE